jgi:hypothetical protein
MLAAAASPRIHTARSEAAAAADLADAATMTLRMRTSAPARSPAAGGPATTLASGLDGNHITPINAHQKQLGQQAPGTPSQVWTSR